MIYLDHAATTPMEGRAVQKMMEWMSSYHVGNPNSQHSQGVAAKHAIQEAKKSIARMINAESPDEIYFFASGTEANVLWKRSLDEFMMLVSTETEHSSNFIALSTKCAGMYKLHVDRNGRIVMDHLRKTKLRSGRDVVSVIWVNNETGTVNPIEEIGSYCATLDVPFHVDATQAAGHIHIDVQRCHIDVMTMSAHKFGGPQGVGILYVRGPGVDAPGTPNVPGIVATGVAAEIATEQLAMRRANWAKNRKYFIEILRESLGDTFWVNGGDECSNIISLTFPGVNAEALLFWLDLDSVYVSARAACASGKDEASHVLTAMGLTEDEARSTIRVSMGPHTTATTMRDAATVLIRRVKQLREEDEPDV